MKHLNTITLEGNMTAAPSMRTANGKPVASFTIATNDGTETTYVRVETWDKRAEVVRDFGGKGKPVIIQGKLKQKRWKDANQHDREDLLIIAYEIFLRGDKDAKGSEEQE
ncbi:single-stranded DNA-binding protein [Leptospira langatensis]|uniref:Single-stranded DNA-binding protein n=1 Tax=Leptospira langatensis TaxID=2484983 RepID=A0A5R2ATK2_9LEPT|nr:single-stranded DNA-binding protein [Leptospira langatensis]TGJ99882.1 single-stranded DNA-binding protein [Leptospira langatensis]